ncbi:TetR/AcrR family transcriptional regulator [Rhizobium sp. Rhizsp82]|uniref:TetR/AcrR family transcriptional regulator n=1 Tax=Rhizobium sp. Rhizsp82 TaxID=3243057 RepID=UPI0039B55E8B
MRYPAHETEEKHQRILREAARAFRAHGLDGVSISDIMKATGLTHGPFYNHFPSKAALAQEVITRTTEQLQETLASLSGSGNAAIHNYYVSATHRDEPENGCVLAACGPEIARDNALRDIAAPHIENVVLQLASGMKDQTPDDARQAALTQFATMVGTIILARACAGHKLSDELLASVVQSLKEDGAANSKKKRTSSKRA